MPSALSAIPTAVIADVLCNLFFVIQYLEIHMLWPMRNLRYETILSKYFLWDTRQFWANLFFEIRDKFEIRAYETALDARGRLQEQHRSVFPIHKDSKKPVESEGESDSKSEAKWAKPDEDNTNLKWN